MIVTQNIYLIGMPGSGKTTIGLLLSSLLKCHFFETDWAVEKQVDTTIAAFLQKNSEEAFREIEAEILKGTTNLIGTVIATGGGTPCFHNNIDFMKAKGLVVWLQVPAATIIDRITERHSAIPALKGTDLESSVPRLLKQRQPYYEQAHLHISLAESDAQLNSQKIAAEITAYLNQS